MSDSEDLNMDDLSWLDDIETPDINYNHYLVLIDLFDFNDVFGDDFRELNYNHYGLTRYEFNDGREYCIGTEKEVQNALYQYWYEYRDSAGLPISDLTNAEDFLVMTNTDRRIIAGDIARNRESDMSDEEILDGMTHSTIYDDILELRVEFENNENLIDELNDGDEYDDDIVYQIKTLEERNVEILSRINNLFVDLREEFFNEEYQEYYDCLEDVVECLIKTHGWYDDIDALINSNLAYFDETSWVKYMYREWSQFADIAYYDGDYQESSVDDETYYVFRLN
jgi:hypothetical protein